MNMILATTEFNKRIMTVEEAVEFFEIPAEEIMIKIESGKPIPKGTRYWFVDWALDD